MKSFSLRLLGLLTAGLMALVACDKKADNPPVDLCKDVSCQNGGTCKDGNCNCPSGYSGNRCQVNNTGVFFKLTNGSSLTWAGTSAEVIGLPSAVPTPTVDITSMRLTNRFDSTYTQEGQAVFSPITIPVVGTQTIPPLDLNSSGRFTLVDDEKTLRQLAQGNNSSVTVTNYTIDELTETTLTLSRDVNLGNLPVVGSVSGKLKITLTKQ